jgi:hypothetical protein
MKNNIIEKSIITRAEYFFQMMQVARHSAGAFVNFCLPSIKSSLVRLKDLCFRKKHKMLGLNPVVTNTPSVARYMPLAPQILKATSPFNKLEATVEAAGVLRKTEDFKDNSAFSEDYDLLYQYFCDSELVSMGFKDENTLFTYANSLERIKGFMEFVKAQSFEYDAVKSNLSHSGF